MITEKKMPNPPPSSEENPTLDAGSFRDREGRVFYHRGKVCRALSAQALEAWQELAASHFFPRLMAEGRVVESQKIDFDETYLRALSPHWKAVLEHRRIPFISYPYEWPFSMLKDAALLQLDLLHQALQEDFVLKDSTPYNVQWQGTSPVFIDVVSFERLPQGDPWVGYLQFCQLFLYPLLLTARCDVAFHPWLRGSLDGISPLEIDRLLGWRDRLRPGGFADVYLQARLQEKTARAEHAELLSADGGDVGSLRTELRRAGFKKELIVGNVKRLQNIVGGLRWQPATSQWSDYTNESSYDTTEQTAKEGFVGTIAAQRHWPVVWDLGCNTGTFSRLVAQHADTVIALDADHLAVESLYRELRSSDDPSAAKILPLVGNLVDPSPNLGWRLGERRALTGRPQPNLILALALIHHVVLTGNVPLPEFLDWLAGLGGELILEWVDRKDGMVERLLRNKEDIYHDYTAEVFNEHLERRFEVLGRRTLHAGTRTLVHARPR
jgi:ribosomal protein L11 methylase PrmA